MVSLMRDLHLVGHIILQGRDVDGEIDGRFSSCGAFLTQSGMTCLNYRYITYHVELVGLKDSQFI